MSKSESHLPGEPSRVAPPSPEALKALSDPTREEIFQFVQLEPRTVRDLAGAFTVSRPTLLRHLSVLEQANLVEKHSEGRVAYYRVNTEVVVDMAYAKLRRTYGFKGDSGRSEIHSTLLEGAILDLTPDELIDTAADIASRHPDLRGRGQELRSLLAWESSKTSITHALAGGPRRLLTDEELEEELQVHIASQAVASIWQEKVLEPRQAAVALGAKETNREKVSSLRRRSRLLGLPREASYLYPAFQFDFPKRRIHPEVRSVNEVLRSSEDPWGVASWWISDNDRLAARPVDLLGSSRSEEVVEAARAVTGSIG
jgi:DNA-binding transcriptional ArsR family regulator